MSKYASDIQEIKTELVRLNQHIKDKIPEIERSISHNHAHLENHETRILGLEKWQYKAIGVSIGAMAIIGLAIKFL